MGLRSTDTVLIHTSLWAIGPIEGGADGLIDAFCDYLRDGLFLVPTHTWANVNRDQPVYDVRSTKPCIGTLPTIAAFRPDGIRSLHPTHSIWAHGHRAADYVRGEEKLHTPAPAGSCWARLADVGAKILLIGVGHNRNTFIHAIDEMAHVPDRIDPHPYEATIIDYDGIRHHTSFGGHCCSKTNDVSQFYPNFEPALVHHGIQRLALLGNAQVRVIDARRCADLLLSILSRADHDLCVSHDPIPTSLYR